MGTRTIEPEGLTFDHAAQFFTVSDPSFAEMVSLWSKTGLVRQLHGAIGELEPGGRFTPFPPSPPRYIGVNGMHIFRLCLLHIIRIKSGIKITNFCCMMFFSNLGCVFFI